MSSRTLRLLSWADRAEEDPDLRAFVDAEIDHALASVRAELRAALAIAEQARADATYWQARAIDAATDAEAGQAGVAAAAWRAEAARERATADRLREQLSRYAAAASKAPRRPKAPLFAEETR